MTTRSETDDAEETISYCDENIIPIFPLRFALTGETLINMTRFQNAPTTPQSLSGSDAHELIRIRKGYVYVFDGDTLQVFWFETAPGDENGSIYREDTEIRTQTLAYTFTKFEFEEGDSRGKWAPLEKSYPYVFVPKDTPKAWVAYSEERWPYRFFYEAETNSTFRKQVMTEIDLATRSGLFCAPITELSTHVRSFTDPAVAYTEKDYTLENAIRHTAVEIEPVSAVVTCENTRQKGVLVALHDPIGEIQDLLGLMSVHSMTLTNYMSEHQYPLTIGKAVKNYKDADEVSTTRWFGLQGPLSSEFESKFGVMLNQIELIEFAQQHLAGEWIRLASQNGIGSVGNLMDACDKVAKRYSFQAHPMDNSETIAFHSILLTRMMTASATSSNMSKALAPLFTGVPGRTVNEGWDSVKQYFDLTIAQTKTILDAGRQYHKMFEPALNALFTVYGTEIVQAGIADSDSPTKRLVDIIFQDTERLHSRDSLQDVFTNIMQNEGYNNVDLSSNPSVIDHIGDTVSSSALMDSSTELLDGTTDGRVRVIEFHAQVDITVNDDYLEWARRANNYEFGINGIGLVAAGLSLHATISSMNDRQRANSSMGEFALNPVNQVIAGFAAAYEATYDISKAAAGRSNSAATNAVLRSVFNNNRALFNVVGANGAAVSGRAIAVKSLGYAAKAAGMVGVVMNGLLAVEGYHREDAAMATGNGLMAVGGLVLLLGATGPLALIAVAAIAIGLVVAMFSYDDAENWVRLSFWGTSGEYWGIDEERNLSQQILEAKALAYPSSNKHKELTEFFEAELEYYLDINSKLELRDSPSIDGTIEISCALLQTASDLSRVSVEAYVDWTWPYNNVPVRSRTTFIAPGKAQVLLRRPTSFKENGPVVIDVTVQRQSENTFEESITVQSNQLW